MKKIEEKIILFIKDNELIKAGDNVLVAFSGGADSVFLLYFLLKYKKKYKINIGALHINHMIRGEAAVSDELFCKKLCKNWKVKLHTVKKNVPAFAKKSKVSIEEAAREIRYKELVRIKNKFGYSKIATGHNCSDNAETLILNLIKGTGIHGLSGIPIRRDSIIRPILPIRKDEIIDYLNRNKIEFIVDQSNFSDNYERNIIRNKLFPIIKQKLNPQIEKSLFNLSLILKKHSLALKYSLQILSERVASVDKNSVAIDIQKIRLVDQSIWNDLFKYLVKTQFNIQLSFNDCAQISSLIKKKKGAAHNLSNNLEAVREGKIVVLQKNQPEKILQELKIKIGQKKKIAGKEISLTRVKMNQVKLSADRSIEYIDAEKVDDDFTIRIWQSGDKFYPLGFKKQVKISDFLTNAKIPAILKKKQLVLVNQNQIICVIGYRISDKVKITNNTRKVLRLWVK